MSTLPSPFYHLLLSPLWLERPARAQQVIEGLAQWDFDPNETHDGVSVLRGVLQNARSTPQTEALLIKVVQALLARGAHAEDAFANDTLIRWNAMPGVKQVLTRQMYPGQRVGTGDAKGFAILGYLRGEGSADQIIGWIDREIGPAGMEGRLDGLAAGAWIMLHARPAGDALPGWCIPQRAYGGEPAHLARMARKIVLQSNLAKTGTAEDRLMAGLGLAAAVKDFSGNNDSRAAQDAALNTARKLVQGLDAPALLQQLAHSDMERDQKSRLGCALLVGGLMLLGKQTWQCAVQAWPLLEDARMNLPEACDKLTEAFGFPDERDIETIERTPANQKILLDFLAGSLGRFSSTSAQARQNRLAYIDTLGRWRAGHVLPLVDIDAIAKHRLHRDPTIFEGIGEALEAMMLQNTTEAAPAKRQAGPRL